MSVKMTSKLLQTFVCLTSIAVAVWGMAQEMKVQSILGRTWLDRITLLTEAGEGVSTGLSARTIRNLVSACAEMRARAPALRGDAELRSRFAQTCASIAEEVLDRAPTHARSLAMALLMAPTMTPVQLAQAQTAAPHEPWPMQIRLWALAETGALDADLLAVAAADFDRALATDWGRTLLARLYVSREDARPAILARAETADARAQRAFLNAVALEQRGGRALDFTRG
ncbi:MAG: hypothetical protein LW715_12565 [Rhodobacter sp.]|jgi:hypothetical protein|nr:hypothetical protein [Rhodobacter sp.]MCE2749559.1 hypothetical protein [Rhodobacter sp.]